MYKIGFLGKSSRTPNLIKQLDNQNYSVNGIYSNDQFYEGQDVKHYSNPFQLIADSDLLVVNYSGEDTRGLLTECILESKPIILDRLHEYSADDICYLQKLAKEAEVQVIPLYHSIYYSLINEVLLHRESDVFSIQVFIHGLILNQYFSSIEEVSFYFMSTARKLLNMYANQHVVFTHNFLSSNFRQIHLALASFNTKLFTMQIDETLSNPNFQILLTTDTKKVVFDLKKNLMEVYQIIGNRVDLVKHNHFYLLPELSFVLNQYFSSSNSSLNNHFLLYDLKENLISWHLVSDSLEHQLIVHN